MTRQYLRQVSGQAFTIHVNFDSAESVDVKVYRQGVLFLVADRRNGGSQGPFDTGVNPGAADIRWSVESVSEARLMDSEIVANTDVQLAYGFRDERGDNRYNSVVVFNFLIHDSGASIPAPPGGTDPVEIPPAGGGTPPEPEAITFIRTEYPLRDGCNQVPSENSHLLTITNQGLLK